MPVSRPLAEDLARVLVELYAAAETRLAADLARMLAADIDAPDWAARKLLAVGSVRQLAERIVRRLDTESAAEVEQMLVLAYARGGQAALDELGRLGSALPSQVTAIRRALPGAEAVQRLVFALVSTLRGTHLRIVRWSLDSYRTVVARASVGTLLGVQTRRRTAQVAWEQLLSQGITGFTDRSGRNWQLASYVEMATRTTVAQAAVEGHLDRLAGAGLDLVIVSNAPQECSLCLVPGTVVEGPAPTWRSRLEYTGDVISITTAGGKDLTGTPNHPVLTPQGWRRLDQIRPGDQVISHNGQKSYPGVMPDDVQVPALIEEAGESRAPLLLAGPTRRDLDSDTAYREVRAVFPDGYLLPEGHTSIGEPLRDLLFVLGIGPGPELFGPDDAFPVLGSQRYAPGGGMGRIEHLGALLGGGFLPSLEHSVAGQSGSLLVGQPGHVVDNGLMSWPGLDSSASEVVADHPAADAEGGAELLRALSGQVAADEVVSVGWRQFRGHVWDLSTEPAWFLANGIVTHNCRPWEGKVLTRTGLGSSRELELPHTTRPRQLVTVEVAGSVAEAVAAGLMHPNCRHSLSAYLPGVTRAPTHTEDPEGDQNRQQLRYLERQVRHWKLRAAAAIDPAAAKVAGGKVREYQGRIREHVAATGLHRQPAREQIGTAR